MNEGLNVGDRVVYEDAYTLETRYGVITNLAGTDAVIRTITKEEAGESPKRLPTPRIACSFGRDEEDTPICSYHRKPLCQLAVQGQEPNPPGVGHFSAWICPTSGKQIFDAGF